MQIATVFQNRPDMPRHNGDVDVQHSIHVDGDATFCGVDRLETANFQKGTYLLVCEACKTTRTSLYQAYAAACEAEECVPHTASLWYIHGCPTGPLGD